MAGFDYLQVVDAVVSILTAANTTTAAVYLSQSMTAAVQHIADDDPETVNIAHLKLPAVFVRVNEKDSDFGSLGQTGSTRNKREADLSIDIFGIVRKDGILNRQQTLHRKLYKLAQNIEAVIENNITLSGTAMWVQPVNTVFSQPVSLSSEAAMKACVVKIRSHHLYR